ERPKLAEMVFNGGSAESQAMPAAQQADSLGGFRACVLDGLRLVEHNVIEIYFLEPDYVAAESAISGENDVVRPEIITVAELAGVVEHAQLRREAFGFLLPVEDQRPRNYDQGRQRRLIRSAPRTAGFEQGENLRGFADTHVIRQAPTE